MSDGDWTVAAIAERVGGRVEGDGSIAIEALDELGEAGSGDLTFIGDGKYAKRWAGCGASAALVSESLADAGLEPGPGRALVWVESADVAMAMALELFATPVPGVPGHDAVHELACVDGGASLGRDVKIGPGAVVHRGARLGDAVRLHAGAVVMDDAVIGDGTVLWPGAVVRERCEVGAGCVLHAQCVIGADGFGYRPVTVDGKTTLMKVPQNGIVRLGDGCEIGAGTTIDRAKFRATVLGDGCKLDNLVQIGHNCVLGRSVIISGCTGLAGSVTVGDGTVIGGMVAIKDHVTIGAGVQIAGSSAVMNDIPDGRVVAGYPAMEFRDSAKVYAARRHLPEIWRRIKAMR
ncbi:MAG: UDP-3-O-(3-hydroxymyristoyl)glucosamine N-acyltransferase [Planctomycetota bacterium]